MNIYHLIKHSKDRHFTKKQWQLLWRASREAGVNGEYLDGDYLAIRQEHAAHIAAIAEEGYVYISYGGRDCDHCTFNGRAKVRASIIAIEQWENNFYDGAEGPQSWDYMDAQEYAEYQQPRSRDLILEAHEDGHPYSVSY